MSNQRHFVRGLTALAMTAGAVALAIPTQAGASATQVGAVLTIDGTFGPDFIEVDVRPDGIVEIRNAPGVVQGTTYGGVTSMRILSQNNDDAIDLLIESPMNIYVDSSTGADSVKVEIKAGTSGNFPVVLNAYTATNSDVVEVKASTTGANLDLSVLHDMSTNDDSVSVDVLGEGGAARLSAKLRTIGSTGSDTAKMVVSSDATTVNVDMGVDPDFYGYRTGVVSGSLVVDHKAPSGRVNANLNMLTSNASVELKGSNSSKVVNGRILGSTGPDSLVIFTEGVATGNVVVDGRSGYDTCKTTVGTRVACEAT